MTAPRVLLAASVALALGCSGGESKSGAGAPPSSFTPDAPSPGGGPTVFLRGSAVGAAGRARVDVVARGIDRDVHGIALRVRWDPAELRFERAQASDAWSPRALRLAREGLPGELVVAWTEEGDDPGVAARGETVLGTLELTHVGAAAAELEIRPERSMLQGGDGRPLAATWIGGRVGDPR
jgi:hypothetical protein